LAGTQTILPSATRTPTLTRLPTRTPTTTPTLVPTMTPSPTPLFSATPTATPLPGAPTATPSYSPTPRPAPTRTPTALPSGASDLYVDTYQSAIMGQEMPFMVYLPPGYAANQRRYPVLYLLHGWGGDHGEWSWYGTQDIADQMMRAGEIPPFIIVCPEGDKAYWFNHYNGPRWGDYMAVEFVDYVDKTFRTIAQRESRAIGGLSMGGQGALSLALLHSDRFSLVGLRSPSWRRAGDPDTPAFFGDTNYSAQFDASPLLRGSAPLMPLLTYFIYGDKDPWGDRSREVQGLLDARHLSYELHVYPGDHTSDFFKTRIDEDLRFYGVHIATTP
jgi:enterochelin esterase-like enzyme